MSLNNLAAIKALALTFLTATLIPMALAQPSSTFMPITPSPVPTASVTPFPDPATYANASLAIGEKDRPQSWLYRSASWRLSAHSMMMAMTILLMVGYFLPAVTALVPAKPAAPQAVPNIEKREPSDVLSTTTASAVDTPILPTAEKGAQADLPPIWVTYYSTTTTFLPTVTVTAPTLETTGRSASHVHLAGDGGDFLIPLPPVVQLPSTCTEKDPAVCPIIEGRKASAGDAGSFIIPLPPVVELPPTCTEKDQALCPIVEGRRTALPAF